ncbi:hypothetical protein [Bradyrhizobium sp. HKCCYLR20261]|uniref:hypothetical protein n=1 Tax=Bradyrhizobium sp. HKCCYLR20261 TaxID=3420760 RepID=UPI003EBDBD75
MTHFPEKRKTILPPTRCCERDAIEATRQLSDSAHALRVVAVIEIVAPPDQVAH